MDSPIIDDENEIVWEELLSKSEKMLISDDENYDDDELNYTSESSDDENILIVDMKSPRFQINTNREHKTYEGKSREHKTSLIEHKHLNNSNNISNNQIEIPQVDCKLINTQSVRLPIESESIEPETNIDTSNKSSLKKELTRSFSNDSVSYDSCFFCFETKEEPPILYQHCGNYYIHQVCLDEWMKENGPVCIVCKENILDKSNNEIGDVLDENSVTIRIDDPSPNNQINNIPPSEMLTNDRKNYDYKIDLDSGDPVQIQKMIDDLIRKNQTTLVNINPPNNNQINPQNNNLVDPPGDNQNDQQNNNPNDDFANISPKRECTKEQIGKIICYTSFGVLVSGAVVGFIILCLWLAGIPL